MARRNPARTPLVAVNNEYMLSRLRALIARDPDLPMQLVITLEHLGEVGFGFDLRYIRRQGPGRALWEVWIFPVDTAGGWAEWPLTAAQRDVWKGLKQNLGLREFHHRRQSGGPHHRLETTFVGPA